MLEGVKVAPAPVFTTILAVFVKTIMSVGIAIITDPRTVEE
jgi:hypothetical protein